MIHTHEAMIRKKLGMPDNEQTAHLIDHILDAHETYERLIQLIGPTKAYVILNMPYEIVQQEEEQNALATL